MKRLTHREMLRIFNWWRFSGLIASSSGRAALFLWLVGVSVVVRGESDGYGKGGG